MVFNALAIILCFGAVLVNGSTDAPNSIATAICTGAIKERRALWLCAIFNFLGVILASFISSKIAKFVFSLDEGREYSGVVACATLLSVIIFGIACSIFSLPSSESHALISALVGASFFETKSLLGLKKVGYVFVFMIFSCIFAFFISLIASRIIPKNFTFKKAQILCCMSNSFMHGWQDGQKLVGILATLMLVEFKAPPYIVFSVAVTMGLGTLACGKGIIKTLGSDLVSLDGHSATGSDIGTYITLLVFSILGAPLSTGNVKALSIVGAGAGAGAKINKKATAKVVLTSIITFPVCFFLGYTIFAFLKLF